MPSPAGLASAPGNSGAGGCHLPPARRSRISRRGDRFMQPPLEPKLGALPPAQREVWSRLPPTCGLNLVLYGGTAIALHLGHRESLDFDFFCSEPLDKKQ